MLWDAGIMKPIPVEDVTYFKDLLPFWVDEKGTGADEHGWPASVMFTDESKKFLRYVPQLWGQDTLTYNWEKVNPMPLSRMVMEDEKYAGKVGMWNAPGYTLRNYAYFLSKNGVIPKPKRGANFMTKEEIDMVIEYLIEKKKHGQYRVIWDSWQQIVDLHTSGELWLSDAWQPVVLECQRRGSPIRYAYCWEGLSTWCHAISIPKAVSEAGYKRAMTFINWWNDGAPGKHACENGYLIATNFARARKHLSEAQYQKWYLGKGRDQGPVEVQMSWVGVWDHWPENSKYIIKRWQQFLSA